MNGPEDFGGYAVFWIRVWATVLDILFAYLVSTLPLGLGFLWIAFDPRKQAWHDKVAGTVVVVRRSKSGGCTKFCVKRCGTAILAVVCHGLEARDTEFRTVPKSGGC